ncbi:TPA: hypothetical protein PFE07_002464 [Kluyvera cryocrescens]|nr:hypothetical protein [Kluyvera cryocrescens]
MAKGSYVPGEIRDEVRSKIIDRYKKDFEISEVTVDFKTDHFPHRGIAYVWLGENPTPFHSVFEYKYGETSEKVLHITHDWLD